MYYIMAVAPKYRETVLLQREEALRPERRPASPISSLVHVAVLLQVRCVDNEDDDDVFTLAHFP